MMILSGRQNWSDGGKAVSCTAIITLYYCDEQIKNCDMYSVYNRQGRG